MKEKHALKDEKGKGCGQIWLKSYGHVLMASFSDTCHEV